MQRIIFVGRQRSNRRIAFNGRRVHVAYALCQSALALAGIAEPNFMTIQKSFDRLKYLTAMFNDDSIKAFPIRKK